MPSTFTCNGKSAGIQIHFIQHRYSSSLISTRSSSVRRLYAGQFSQVKHEPQLNFKVYA